MSVQIKIRDVIKTEKFEKAFENKILIFSSLLDLKM